MSVKCIKHNNINLWFADYKIAAAVYYINSSVSPSDPVTVGMSGKKLPKCNFLRVQHSSLHHSLITILQPHLFCSYCVRHTWLHLTVFFSPNWLPSCLPSPLVRSFSSLYVFYHIRHAFPGIWGTQWLRKGVFWPREGRREGHGCGE